MMMMMMMMIAIVIINIVVYSTLLFSFITAVIPGGIVALSIEDDRLYYTMTNNTNHRFVCVSGMEGLEVQHALTTSFNDVIFHEDGINVYILANDVEMELLNSFASTYGLTMKISIDNVSQYFADRLRMDSSVPIRFPILRDIRGEEDRKDEHEELTRRSDIETAADLCTFGVGSMGGYPTASEIEAFMWSLHALYPSLVSVPQALANRTWLGKDILAFYIHDVSYEDESDAPEVLLHSLLHGREPAGFVSLAWTMCSLLSSYESFSKSARFSNESSLPLFDVTIDHDPYITAGVLSPRNAAFLMRHRKMWFIPLVNPDGYIFNAALWPNGGGLHRKNVRPNVCGPNPGVDINRNFPHLDHVSESAQEFIPCSDVFSGYSDTSPEPESSALRSFIKDHSFSIVLSFHSFGDLLVYVDRVPHIKNPLSRENEEIMKLNKHIGERISVTNGYLFGSDIETVGYHAHGTMEDWIVNMQHPNISGVSYSESDNKISLAYTVEVGNCEKNSASKHLCFWPSIKDAVRSAKVNVNAVFVAALYAGVAFEIDIEFTDNKSNYIYDPPSIQLIPGDDFSVSATVGSFGNANPKYAPLLTVYSPSGLVTCAGIDVGAISTIETTVSGKMVNVTSYMMHNAPPRRFSKAPPIFFDCLVSPEAELNSTYLLYFVINGEHGHSYVTIVSVHTAAVLPPNNLLVTLGAAIGSLFGLILIFFIVWVKNSKNSKNRISDSHKPIRTTV